MHHAQNLACLLYEAADECSYVDPDKVQQILGVTWAEARSQSGDGGDDRAWEAVQGEWVN